ncbi:hypothetical protein FB446DRAFT_793402 [Lentinula raphanica]|nr:hypothetical protein FB446DRAFT_793402 [Lentinula raphanica]
MPKFVYDVPKNSTGTTLIAFPSLNEAAILHQSLHAYPEPKATLATTFTLEETPTSLDIADRLAMLKSQDQATPAKEFDAAIPAMNEVPHQQHYHTRQSERLSLSTHGSISSRTSFSLSSSSSKRSSNHGSYRRRKATEPYPLPPNVNTLAQGCGGVYTNQNTAKVKGREIWTQWFCHRSSDQLDYPPNPPAGLQLDNNVLFVHINTDLEASIRAQMGKKDTAMPPALLRCLTIWIWKEHFNAWWIIDFGDSEMFDDGSLLALSLGGKSGIEPRWILCESMSKKGFKKGVMKRRLI